MSGSPPPEQPAEPSQIAGRRRKRSLTPPTTTGTVASTLAPATPTDTTNPRTSTLARGGETIGELPSHPGPYALHYPPPPDTYHAASGLLPSSVGTVDARFTLSPISPRATRKPKAHVASACVNCKKKHLRCDNSRPCRRCTQSGKEDSCVDVEHKKRGRPPLKPDDPSITVRYQSTTPQYQPSLPAIMGPPRAPTTYQGYSQGPGLAPILPSPPSWAPQPPRNIPSYYPSPAQPSISYSLATAEGSFAAPPSNQYGYQPIRPGQSPFPQAGTVEHEPRLATYGGYGYPPLQGQAGIPHTYSNPIFPRLQSSSLSTEQPRTYQTSAALQLPPINIPTTSAIDPAIVRQSSHQGRPTSQQEQERQDTGSREPDAKRPKMDIKGILGPRHD